MQLKLLSCLACLLGGFSGCSESDTARPTAAKTELTTSSPAASNSVGALDACTLLTNEEIQSIQGEPVKEAKKTGTTNGPLTVSQCYFTLPTFSNSISLTVVQNGQGPAGRSAAAAWKEIFSDAKLQEVETEKGNRKLPPRRIADLGDEAFWVGSEVIGALHVLQGEYSFTLSVGGAGDQTSKIEKTTALARSILPRLARSGY